MVKIRMRRTGCTNHATYRIVAADVRSPRDGKFLEILGSYDTQVKENNFKLDLARVDYWPQRISAMVAKMPRLPATEAGSFSPTGGSR